jgi:outer membrane protein assembly factor BamB
VALSSAGAERWSAKLNGNARIVLVQDADADGRPEVCVGTERGFVHVFDAKGAQRWQFECAHRPGPVTALNIADLDGNGRPELLAGSQGYVLYVFESSGQLKWRNPIDIPWGGVRAIIVRDFDGQPGPEIFVATGADHGDVMLTGDGRKLWRLSTTTSHAVATDLRGEGREQLLVGGPMKAGPLRLINPANGSALWNAGIDDDVRAILPLRSDGTGKREILVGYATAGLWQMDGRSEKRRLRSFPALVNTVIPLDERGGGGMRFAVGCEDGTVHVVGTDGRTLASLKLPRPVTSLRSLSLGGRPGVFVTTRNGPAAALELQDVAAP